MKIKYLLLLSFIFTLGRSAFSIEPYQNPALAINERVNDLLNHLTLEEKVQLMSFDSPAIPRLNIKAYNWWNECLHGVARSGLATVFPEAIGMAAMWDQEQMYQIANAISDEARAKYNDFQRQQKYGIYMGLTFWTPNINIFRDPRWGRGMETYGEDPFLTSELAIPFVKGLQGNDPNYLKLVATVKHFAVHSGPESTRHSFNVRPSEYDLAETYLPHFKRTVQEASPYSVMCAYQRLNGAPCCGSQFLENILRNEWNFKGYIVSDCGAINDFYEKNAHHITATPEEASAMAVQAGTDLNCGDTYGKYLLNAVQQHLVTESEINVLVKRLLTARFKLGEFDSPQLVKYAQIPLSVVDCEEHKKMALEAAHKSIVLLENKNQFLPFSKNLKKVAVIGPNANDADVLLGNYNGYPSSCITPLQGIINKLPNTMVSYAQGCRLADELPCLKVIPSSYLFIDPTLKTSGLKGEYFGEADFKGKIIYTRIDSTLDFKWWTAAPFNDMKNSAFSVRWTGVLVPKITGKYAIGGEGFAGFDIYINDKKLVAGKPEIHHPRKNYEFIQLEAGKKYKIRFDFARNNSEYALARLLWDTPDSSLLKNAVDLAKQSDLVVMCMGLSPMLEGEEMKVKVPAFDGGDRLDIQLPESQKELIKAIVATKKPAVLVLLNGSALAFNQEKEALPAILEAWYPGQAGGQAIADIIFGDYNPSGRLPLTFYKDIHQISSFDEYDMKGKTYRYFNGEPMYEFGYGLSYSTFAYEILKQPTSINIGDSVHLEVSVSNKSAIDGDEVVQLYISLPDSKLRKPIRSLQAFQRIHLKAGEQKIVQFTLAPTQFTARDEKNNAVIEPGKVLISIGGKQPDLLSLQRKAVVQASVQLLGSSRIINK